MSEPDIFGQRARRAVVVIALLSVFASALALIYGDRLTEPDPKDADSYGKGELSHRALVETLEELGVHVERMRGARHSSARAPMIFIEPEPKAKFLGKKLELHDVLRERSRAGLVSVVVLPKWQLLGDGSVSARDSDEVGKVLGAAIAAPYSYGAPDVTWTPPTGADVADHEVRGPLGTFRVHVPALMTIAGGAAVLAADSGNVVARFGETIYVVSDADIVHSFNVQRADHARLLATLMKNQLGTDTVIIDEVFHGHGTQPSLAGALGDFPASLFAIHGLGLLMLCVLAGGRRFGPPIEPAGLGRGPLEVIGVAASVFAAGRSASRLGSGYVDMVLRDLGDRLGIEAASDDDRIRRLDAMAERAGIQPRAAPLYVRARELAGQRRAGLREVVRLARDAWSHRTDLLRLTRARRNR